jgi:outer membrane protein W
MIARRLLCSLMLTLVLGALPAAAQEPSRSGLALGVRGAYGIPVGDAFEGTELADTFGTTVAPQVDVAYFFNEWISLGGYFQYGFASGPDDQCANGERCKSKVLRFGVDLDFHFRRASFLSPWVGIGVGYEIGTLGVGENDSVSRLKLEGYDLGHAHFGLDLQLTRSIAVGPYLSASVGQYSEGELRLGTGSVNGEFADDQKKLHVWLQPGVRLQLRL